MTDANAFVEPGEASVLQSPIGIEAEVRGIDGNWTDRFSDVSLGSRKNPRFGWIL